MSRTCLPSVLMCNVIFCVASSALGAEVVLPEGSAPPPIVSRHFPDRVHEFVSAQLGRRCAGHAGEDPGRVGRRGHGAGHVDGVAR